MNTLLKRSSRLGAIVSCIPLVSLFSSLAGCNKTKDVTANQPSVAIDTAVDDSVITAKVKAALLVSGDLKSLDLQVQTKDHEVTLSGFADNRDQVDNSIAITRSIDRVTSVVNHITVKK